MNGVMLAGSCVSEISLKYTDKQQAVCNFTVAVKSKIKKGDYEFIDCTAWGVTAENIKKYVYKGREIAIQGFLHKDEYIDKNNVKHYPTIVTVELIDFLGTSKK